MKKELDEGRERRAISREASKLTIETRADGKEYITGRAIVFNQWSKLMGGWFKEIIEPGALDNCDLSDVVAKFNHDVNFTLGRTPDSLELEVRADGLYYSFPYDAQDPDHVKVRRKIERGDVKGSSFEFTLAVNGSVWDRDAINGYETRTIKSIGKVFDVAPVVFPAYEKTDVTIAARDFDAVKEQRQSLEDERNQQLNQQEAPEVTVAPLSIYERQLQLLSTVTK